MNHQITNSNLDELFIEDKPTLAPKTFEE